MHGLSSEERTSFWSALPRIGVHNLPSLFWGWSVVRNKNVILTTDTNIFA